MQCPGCPPRPWLTLRQIKSLREWMGPTRLPKPVKEGGCLVNKGQHCHGEHVGHVGTGTRYKRPERHSEDSLVAARSRLREHSDGSLVAAKGRLHSHGQTGIRDINPAQSNKDTLPDQGRKAQWGERAPSMRKGQGGRTWENLVTQCLDLHTPAYLGRASKCSLTLSI